MYLQIVTQVKAINLQTALNTRGVWDSHILFASSVK